MTKLKIGRIFFDIDENDIILFNGACWQLITKVVWSGWHGCYPTVSKKLCEKFVKKDILVLFRKEGEYLTSDGKQMGLYYYKFDMKKLDDYLSEE